MASETVQMPRTEVLTSSAVEMFKAGFAEARPTEDNAIEIPLAARIRAAVLAEVKP